MRQQDRDKVLAHYQDAKKMFVKAEADPTERGFEHALEALQLARKIMRDYRLSIENCVLDEHVRRLSL